MKGSKFAWLSVWTLIIGCVSGQTTSTALSTGFSATSTVPATLTSTSSSASSSTADADEDDYSLYLQRELYLIEPDTGIEYDCPDGNLTLYISEQVPLNASFADYATVLANSVLIIPNNWTSYCGDISDMTLLGWRDNNMTFANESDREIYYKAFADPDLQYAVVLLNNNTNIDVANRSLTFDAQGDDYHSIIGAVGDVPSNLAFLNRYSDYTGASQSNSTAATNSSSTALSRKQKRGSVDGAVKLVSNLIKVAPKWAKPGLELFKQGMKIGSNPLTYFITPGKFRGWGLKQTGSEIAKDLQDPSIELNLQELPYKEGFEGYKYELYEFYDGKRQWAEIWRQKDPNYTPRKTADNGQKATPTSQRLPSSTRASASASSSISVPKCSWKRNKTPFNTTQAGNGGLLDAQKAFSSSDDKVSVEGDVSLDLDTLAGSDSYQIPENVESVFDAATSVLKLVRLNPPTATATPKSPSATADAKRRRDSSRPQGDLVLPGSELQNGQLSVEATELAEYSGLEPRADSNCKLKLQNFALDFAIGDTDVDVLTSTLKLSNYSLYTSGTLALTCAKPLAAKTFGKRLYQIPIGGCATDPSPLLAVDTFLILYLSGNVSTGAGGSLTVDFGYEINPLDLSFALGSSDESSRKTLDITLPSIQKSFHLKNIRFNATFPDFHIDFNLAPSLQIDINAAAGAVKYTRGFGLGGVFDVSGGVGLGLGSASTGSSTPTSTALATTSLVTPTTVGPVNNLTSTQLSPSSTQGSSSSSSSKNGLQASLSAIKYGIAYTTYAYGVINNWVFEDSKKDPAEDNLKWLVGPSVLWN